MPQDKKTEEREYLQYFLSSDEGKNWLYQNRITSCRESEAPDFIFTTKNKQEIGFETTTFIVKSKHGKALQHLMSIGNQVIKYTKKNYGIDISIVIDRFNHQMWQAQTYKGMLEAVYDIGFRQIYDKRIIKSGLEKIIDKNIEKLKRWPCFVKEHIVIQDEYFNISISGHESINGKFDCSVNNECIVKEDPFDELQNEIDKKNKKINSYLEKCDRCLLLIYLPDVSKGNYCHFTEKLYEHKFYTKFESIYICKGNKIFTDDNFVKKLQC